MDKQLLSIEVSERLTKICLITKKHNTTTINKSVCFHTPYNAIMEGHISNPELLANAITRELLQNEIHGIKSAIFVLSSPKIVNRKISLPPIKPKQVKSVIMTNAADYFPIDLTNFRLAHTVLEHDKHKGVSVLVSAVPVNLLKDYENLADILDLNIQGFDYVANSEHQTYKKLNAKGVQMYLSVDTRQSLATFMQDGVMLLQRIVPFGCDEIINSVMLSCDFEESRVIDAIKLCKDDEMIYSYIEKERHEFALKTLTNGVLRAIDFFKSSNKVDIDEIVLVNTCSSFVGLKEALMSATDINVCKFSDLPHSDKIIHGKDADFFLSTVGAMFEPLSISSVNSTKKNKQTIKKEKNKKYENASAYVLMVFFILCGSAMAGFSYVTYGTMYELHQSYLQRQEELYEISNIYNEYLEYEVAKQAFQNITDDAMNTNSGLRQFIEEMEVKMPTNLIALNMTADLGSVSFSFTCDSYEEAVVTLSQFRTFKSIENLEIASVSKAGEEGEEEVTFSVTAFYVIEEEVVTTDELVTEQTVVE